MMPEANDETQLPMHVQVATDLPRRIESRSLMPKLLIVGGIVASVLAVVLWFALRDSMPNQIVDEQQEAPSLQEPVEPEIVQTPEEEPTERPRQAPPLDATPESSPEMDVPDKAIVDVPTQPTMPEPKREEPPKLPKTTPDSPDTTVPKVAAALWETRGVVGVRASVREPWRGLNAVDRPLDSEFLTLGTSRAVTKGPTGIEFVLAEQSEVAGLTWGEVAEVKVVRGGAAFRSLKKGDTVRFLLGDKTWEASATLDDTAVALNLAGLEPQLIVWSGKADVGSVRISRRSVVGFSKPKDVRKLVNAETQASGWIDNWSQSQFNGTSLANLMNSNNLRADVLAMGAGRKLTMMVAPEVAVFQLLNSANAGERQTALWWLMNNPDRGAESDGGKAWANIAQAVGNPSVTSFMKSWLNQLRTGQAARPVDAQQMVRALGISPRAVRFVAIACLQYHTGTTRGFDPNGTNAERQAAINRWAAWLRSL